MPAFTADVPAFVPGLKLPWWTPVACGSVVLALGIWILAVWSFVGIAFVAFGGGMVALGLWFRNKTVKHT